MWIFFDGCLVNKSDLESVFPVYMAKYEQLLYIVWCKFWESIVDIYVPIGMYKKIYSTIKITIKYDFYKLSSDLIIMPREISFQINCN